VGTILNDDPDPASVPGFVGLVDDPEHPGRKMLMVVGTSANNALTILQRLWGQEILVRVNNVTVGVFDHNLVGRIVVFGLEGNDRIVVDALLGKSCELHGDAGNDTIYGATGNDELFGGEGDDFLDGRRGSDLLYGEDGNDRLYGGLGHDILLGGTGNDLLYGGNDRDILIGGLDTDKLYGENGDDILIGGTTAFDDDEVALVAILSEWTSGNDYATRVSNIRDGLGQSDGNSLSADVTVIDDGVIDDLFGGGNQDWFFNPDATNDRFNAKDKKVDEMVN
jgi:hypothetical protein